MRDNDFLPPIEYQVPAEWEEIERLKAELERLTTENQRLQGDIMALSASLNSVLKMESQMRAEDAAQSMPPKSPCPVCGSGDWSCGH